MPPLLLIKKTRVCSLFTSDGILSSSKCHCAPLAWKRTTTDVVLVVVDAVVAAAHAIILPTYLKSMLLK